MEDGLLEVITLGSVERVAVGAHKRIVVRFLLIDVVLFQLPDIEERVEEVPVSYTHLTLPTKA